MASRRRPSNRGVSVWYPRGTPQRLGFPAQATPARHSHPHLWSRSLREEGIRPAPTEADSAWKVSVCFSWRLRHCTGGVGGVRPLLRAPAHEARRHPGLHMEADALLMLATGPRPALGYRARMAIAAQPAGAVFHHHSPPSPSPIRAAPALLSSLHPLWLAGPSPSTPPLLVPGFLVPSVPGSTPRPTPRRSPFCEPRVR